MWGGLSAFIKMFLASTWHQTVTQITGTDGKDKKLTHNKSVSNPHTYVTVH